MHTLRLLWFVPSPVAVVADAWGLTAGVTVHAERNPSSDAQFDALASGQQRALARLLRSLAEKPRRAIDVFGALFARSVGEDNVPLLGMATGEAIACLNYLLARREVQREPDAAGVDWYRIAPA